MQKPNEGLPVPGWNSLEPYLKGKKMNPEEFGKAIETIMGTLDNFDTLLHNHMTEFATKFGRLKAAVESSIQQAKALAEVRDKALHQKIDAYKWGLILVAMFAVISLGGFVTLAIMLVGRGL